MLLIGESGVGKSTWINAVANYLKFATLEEAVEAGGLFPIPCHFEILDEQTKELITISSEGDGKAAIPEDAEVGESVTKMPNEYVFPYEYFQLNLIDTPGLMDTQDTSDHSVDKEHVNNILRLLSSYDEIQAICILLKSSENRLSNALKYTLTEITKHLDTGAANNVIFIFTYASGTNFNPSKPQAVLRKFMKDNHLNIPLPPNKPTIYSVEDAVMDYLAQCKNNIPQTKVNQDDAKRNWERSLNSTVELFDYVCELKPHSVTSINAIYNAEHTIAVLSELVLEMSMCSLKNVAALERKEEEAAALREAITRNPLAFARDDLKQLLIRKEETVVVKPLGHTNVVCKSAKCSQVVVDAGDSFSVVRKCRQRICCEKCKSPLMYFCLSMSWKGECKVCGCGKGKHEWRVTEQVVETREVHSRDESVIEKVVSSVDAVREIDAITATYRRRVNTSTNETEQMLSTCAKLNSFVQHSALMASSDVDKLSERLQDKILTCERVGDSAAAELDYLKKIQHHYNKAKVECGGKNYRTSDVDELIQQLYRLPMKGRDLKVAMEAEEKAKCEVIERGRKARVGRMISYWKQHGH